MINEQSQQFYTGTSSARSEMIQFLPKKYSKVLEIGCNVGNFRQYVSESCEYWGVEPFKEAADIAKAKMDKVLIGFYDQVADEIPNNHFDLIIANDVIEHMEQPWTFLQSIKKKMAKNASIVLSIPNVRYYNNLKELLYEKDWKYKDWGILDITHLRFFTEKSIVRLFTENDFEITKMKGVNSLSIRKRYLRSYCKYLLHKFVLGSDIDFLHFGVRAKIK
ncbi:MAG: class I SAM-dependent methyltransferase [Fibromonadaceae bacterium]|jgi:2-polyprenyl-3-methyl-5-hydroxy-6-metoxy-1,4-benzoquinol methylase|nr:class I SAM-dependent methyltransferase [Fibromonadaceae bacterium]